MLPACALLLAGTDEQAEQFVQCPNQVSSTHHCAALVCPGPENIHEAPLSLFQSVTPPGTASCTAVGTARALAVHAAVKGASDTAHHLSNVASLVASLLAAGDAAVLRAAKLGCGPQLDRHPILEEGTLSFGPHAVVSSHQVFIESEHAYVSVNMGPVVPGHTLIVARRPAERMAHLQPAEIADLWATVHRVQRGLETLLGTPAATVVLQDGPAAGQTVPQVHVHVLPRQPEDLQAASCGTATDGDEVYDMVKGSEGGMRDAVEGVAGGGAWAAVPLAPPHAHEQAPPLGSVAGWAAFVVRCAGVADDGGALPLTPPSTFDQGGVHGAPLTGNVTAAVRGGAATPPPSGRRVKRQWVVRGRSFEAMAAEAAALRAYFAR